jgi:hypothetical protein
MSSRSPAKTDARPSHPAAQFTPTLDVGAGRPTHIAPIISGSRFCFPAMPSNEQAAQSEQT